MTCPNQISGVKALALTVGQTAHVTVADAVSCAQLGPAGVTFTPSSVVSLAPDATGFNVTGMAAGTDTIIFSRSGYANVNIGVSVSAAGTMVVTSP